MTTMTKKQLIDELVEESAKQGRLKIARAHIEAVIDDLATVAAAALADGHAFVIPGVVKLQAEGRPARQGRNPATGEPVAIPAKRVIKARAAPALARLVEAVANEEDA